MLPPSRADRTRLARLPARTSGPGSSTATGSTGPYEPARGLRFNPFKLLIDPYAHALAGRVDYAYHPFAYPFDQPGEDWVLDDENDAGGVPKGVVIDPHFDWKGDAPPRIPWHRTVIYEAHVKGLTMLHPEIPEELRGHLRGGCASRPSSST